MASRSAKGEKALLGPGLHWSFPYPIDEVVKIPIKEIQKVTSTVGWYAVTPEQELSGTEPPAGPTLNPAVDGYVITADRNIIHTRATLYYQVNDPIRYVFGFTNGRQHRAERPGQRPALHCRAFRSGRASFTAMWRDFRTRWNSASAPWPTRSNSASPSTIAMCDSISPRQLKDVFDQVTEARENRNKVLDDAHTYENQITNTADAQASAIVNEAISARARYVAVAPSRRESVQRLAAELQNQSGSVRTAARSCR